MVCPTYTSLYIKNHSSSRSGENADEVLRHVDVEIHRKKHRRTEGNKYIDTSNPFGKLQ